MYYYRREGGSTVAFLRVTKLLHTRNLYHQLRHHYGDRSTSSARLIADIQFLYCFSLAVIHIMACVWFDMTTELPVYAKLDHTTIIGDIRTGDYVSPW